MSLKLKTIAVLVLTLFMGLVSGSGQAGSPSKEIKEALCDLQLQTCQKKRDKLAEQLKSLICKSKSPYHGYDCFDGLSPDENENGQLDGEPVGGKPKDDFIIQKIDPTTLPPRIQNLFCEQGLEICLEKVEDLQCDVDCYSSGKTGDELFLCHTACVFNGIKELLIKKN